MRKIINNSLCFIFANKILIDLTMCQTVELTEIVG